MGAAGHTDGKIHPAFLIPAIVVAVGFASFGTVVNGSGRLASRLRSMQAFALALGLGRERVREVEGPGEGGL